MPSLEKVSFAVASVGVVISLAILKRKKTRMTAGPSDLNDFLDWMDADSDIPDASERGFLSPIEGPNSPVAAGDNVMFRSLAAVGLASTTPAQARKPRTDKTPNSCEHPATGNEEIADDVVRVQRVSEAEEAERYFSAFSYYDTR